MKVYELMEQIIFKEVHRMGESTTAFILALSAHLAMLKKQQGYAIALFFSYARRAGKTNLKAVQLRFSGSQ